MNTFTAQLVMADGKTLREKRGFVSPAKKPCTVEEFEADMALKKQKPTPPPSKDKKA